MKIRAWPLLLIAAGVSLLMLGTSPGAEESHHGRRTGQGENICLQMEPFFDTIQVRDVRIILPPRHSEQSYEVGTLQWIGQLPDQPPTYTLEGVSTVHHTANRIVLHAVAENPSEFFGGHPLCQLIAIVSPETMVGPWRFTCGEFVVLGTTAPTACVDAAVVDASLQALGLRATGADPRLAGSQTSP
jgi:hypothetical protein